MARITAALLALTASAGLGGCAYGYGDGYGGVSVGYGSGGYYDDYYSAPYYGWYDGYYYPGAGYYVYDQGGHRHKWKDHHRRYWDSHRHGRNGRENWADYRRDGDGRGDWRGRQDGDGGDRAEWRGRQGDGDRAEWRGRQGDGDRAEWRRGQGDGDRAERRRQGDGDRADRQGDGRGQATDGRARQDEVRGSRNQRGWGLRMPQAPNAGDTPAAAAATARPDSGARVAQRDQRATPAPANRGNSDTARADRPQRSQSTGNGASRQTTRSRGEQMRGSPNGDD